MRKSSKIPPPRVSGIKRDRPALKAPIVTSKDVNSDYDSPGFEFLRTYHCMDMLYQKLLMLNYRKEFCPNYKCPNIHSYYFSIQHKKQSEQQFLFTCLCAWLIKDKCQMNLDLEPQEYEDLDYTIDMIMEALKLLISPENGPKVSSVGFPPARLKQGYGPEVIWTMNILADRALELLVSTEPDSGKVEITFHDKLSPEGSKRPLSAITIGQPVVGGGLTTRPLGSYQVDDSTLVFDSGDDPSDLVEIDQLVNISDDVDPVAWYAQVEKSEPQLQAAALIDGVNSKSQHDDLNTFLDTIRQFNKDPVKFMADSKPQLDSVTRDIERHLQATKHNEKFRETNLDIMIQGFLRVYKEFFGCYTRNGELMSRVSAEADNFEASNTEIRSLNEKIQSQVRELNDASSLRDLEQATNGIERENKELNVKIGLLLTVYAKVHQEFVEGQKRPA